MFARMRAFGVQTLLALFAVSCACSTATAGEGVWKVSKSSGQVWVTTADIQQASLTDETILKPGDNIRTGRNGRVLLTRDDETILISPNSVIGIPTEKKEGLSTTIVQQAGSILLKVEKRDVRHFEVETPYLAAVVKGTEFRVSTDGSGAHVDVLRGSVEVADFRSGQYALVLPGQAARVSARGSEGLSLSGSGSLNPIQQGSARPSSLKPVPVPKAGLSAPRSTPNGQTVHALNNGGRTDKGSGSSAKIENSVRGHATGAHSALRIASPLGEVKLNFQKVTHGLARAAEVSPTLRGNAAKETVWSSGELTPDNGSGKTVGQGNSNANGIGNASANSNANSNSNGNGNATGNSIAVAVGNGNGNNGNNGNGNNGNNGKGKGKGG